jgi:hypothetical protein
MTAPWEDAAETRRDRDEARAEDLATREADSWDHDRAQDRYERYLGWTA